MYIAECILAVYGVYWLWQRREKVKEHYRIWKKRRAARA